MARQVEVARMVGARTVGAQVAVPQLVVPPTEVPQLVVPPTVVAQMQTLPEKIEQTRMLLVYLSRTCGCGLACLLPRTLRSRTWSNSLLSVHA